MSIPERPLGRLASVIPQVRCANMDLDVVLVGSEDLTLCEQSKEVHKVWDGVLIAFATEASDHDLVAVLSEGPMTTCR